MVKDNSVVIKLNFIADIIEKFINICVCILIGMISVSVIILVIGRRFSIPVVWLGELGTYATIWAVYFGLAIGYKNGLFAKVDIITKFIPIEKIKYIELLWDIICLIIMTIILISFKDYFIYVAKSMTKSPELRLPLFIVYLGPAIGYVFTSYFTIVNIINNFYGYKTNLKSAEGERLC